MKHRITLVVDVSDESTLDALVGALSAQAEEAADDWAGSCSLISVTVEMSGDILDALVGALSGVPEPELIAEGP